MFTPVLLRPYTLGFMNEIRREYQTRFWNKTTFGLLFITFLIYGLCSISYSFLEQLQDYPLYTPDLLTQILSVSLLGLLCVTTFSSVISALGALFSAKDLNYLLTAPLSMRRIFTAKYLHILFLSCWMFALLGFAFAVGVINSFNCSMSVIPMWAVSFLMFCSIPTSLGVITVIIFANVVPADRLKEVIVLTVIIGLFFLLAVDYQVPINTDDHQSIQRAVSLSERLSYSQIWWLPTSSFANILVQSAHNKAINIVDIAVLSLTSLGTLGLAYLTFHFYFLQGWAKSTNSNIQRIIYKSDLLSKVGNFIFPAPSTYRAFAGKEMRSFIRDTTQSVQLLLLLTLTFIYLYNFRVMHSSTIVNQKYQDIWKIVLCSANVLLGGSVLAAICTRFVYPSISLEGSSYIILRSSPLTSKDFVRLKFLTWFAPIGIISIILFGSGALAISADFETLALLSFVAINLAASLVAVAIATGAAYARFNWDNPIQIISSFGSLIYMFLAMGIIAINLIPSSSLFFLTHSDYVREHIILIDRTTAYICCAFLLTFLNGGIISRSLIYAEQHLENNEKILG